MKFLQYGVWDGIKYKLIWVVGILAAVFFIAVFVYTFPEAVAQQIVGGVS